MIYQRRYLQYNDLVFDGYDMISDFNSEVSFKGSSTSYSYRHGSYRPFKNSYLYVNERQVNMTITLKLKKLPCEYREYYVQFALEELSKPGILWSVKNGEILWAVAVTENVSEVINHRKDIFEIDVNFVIPGGIWHKADKQRTFVLPYDVCLFMECKGYKTLYPCLTLENADCCESCVEKAIEEKEDCHCCCVNDITEDMALCHHLDDIPLFYTCDTPFQLIIDCEKAEKFNKDSYFGQKLCTNSICDSAVIAGRIYSETDVPTDDVDVIIQGKMKNPWIKINGNTNIIMGEYDGALKIKSNGDVYYTKGDGCRCEELLDPSVWVVPTGNEYGWTINPGNNSIVVYLNDCCQGAACVWIDSDSITL